MLKALNQPGIEGTYLKIIRQTHHQHHMERAKAGSTPLENQNKTSMPTPILHSTRSHSQSNQVREKNKRHPNRKRGGQTISVCK